MKCTSCNRHWNGEPIKSTRYCNLIAEGQNTMDLEDRAAIQKNIRQR